MHKRIRRILNCAKERASVSYAKIATNGGFCDIDFIIVKATSPDDLPLEEKYVLQLLQIFCVSPSSSHTFSLSFAQRFHKTQSWRVALKCLLLLHRLLRSLSDDTPFRAELLWARANGFLSLYPCYFRDSCSSSSPEDYNAFITSYAYLLDEVLNCVPIQMPSTQEIDQPERTMEELGRMIEILPQLQVLIDGAIKCWPRGAAATSFLIQSAMKYVIRDSFTCYSAYRTEIVKVLENLIQLPYKSCVAAFNIYKKAAIQADQLCEFYSWCKSMGLCGSYEYPFIDRIPQIQIRALESFLDDMWQLTDQSSLSTISPLASTFPSPSLTEDDTTTSKQLIKEVKEVEPLIKWVDENENLGWEDLLEASINTSPSRNIATYYHSHGYEHGNYYYPNYYYSLQSPKPFNFHKPATISANELYPGSDPLYPWGL